MSYAVDLGITLAIEVPVVVAVGRGFGVRARAGVVASVSANLLTHPLFWFVVAPWVGDSVGVGGLVVAEVAVVLVEATVYSRWFGAQLGRWVAAWVALLANALSLGVGVVLR